MSDQEKIKQLHEALQAASDHLDYCGWGDSWERECAEPIMKQVADALQLVEAA